MLPGKSIIQTADCIIWNKNIVIGEIQLDFVKYEKSVNLFVHKILYCEGTALRLSDNKVRMEQILKELMEDHSKKLKRSEKVGLVRESNPGPLAP